jgi:hypothetical protein
MVAALLTAATPAAAQSAFPDLPPEEPEAPPPPSPPPPPPPAPTPPPPAAATAPPYYYYPPAAPAPSAVAPAAPPATGSTPAAPPATGPAVLPYRDGTPVPPGYRLERSRLNGLAVAGGLVLGAGWAVGLGIAAAHGFDHANGWLVVPVLGPWVSLGRRQAPCNIENVEVRDDVQRCVKDAMNEATLIAAIAVDGLFQVIGGGLLLGGVFSTRQELVRKDVARVRLTPLVAGRSGYGLGLLGSF